MNGANPVASEVLRGMIVEAVPLCLARTRTRSGGDAGAGQRAEQLALDAVRRQCLEDAARQGHEEGMRAGYEAGLRKGLSDAGTEVRAAVDKATAEERAELASRRARVDALAGELRKAMGTVLAAAEDEMVALCFETLCRMVVDTSVREPAVRANLLALAGAVRPAELVALHVHPDELAWLDAVPADDGTPLPLVGDPLAGVGGCIVKCRAGGLDARLESMLRACKAALLEARAQKTFPARETP